MVWVSQDLVMSLSDWGWTDELSAAFLSYAAKGMEPARVVCELRRNFYAVQTESDELLAECGGGFFHHARTPDEFPAVGDWAAVKRRPGEARADLHALLPRRTKFSRRAAGSVEIEQVVAANVDVVFLVSWLDRNFNPKRIQRFLVAANESGAQPVIILNKADLSDNPEDVRTTMEGLAPGVAIHVTSTTTRKGLKALTRLYAQAGRTLAFIGSSGVGKSSLINALVRDADLPTAEVREKDSKGRHTTTRRELVRTPSGAMVIDTPGMRELQLWGVEEGVENTFADIRDLGTKCRFSNCGHTSEPGCAVQAALNEGTLDRTRYEAYCKLKDEQSKSKPWRNRPDGSRPFRHREHSDD